MLRVALSIFALATLCLAAHAQIKLQIQFPHEGKWKAWVGAKPPQGAMPGEAKSLEGRTADFAPGEFGPSDSLFILDETSGNLAVRPLANAKSPVTLAPSDFGKIGQVRVRVEHKGLPVESASINMKSGADSRTQLLDSSSGGETSFFAVAPGPIKVSVQYKTVAGDTPDPITQITEAKLQRSKPEVVLVVSIPDEVATIAEDSAPAKSGSAPGEPAAEPEERGGMGFLGRLISFLLAVALAAALVYFGFKWMKSNQDKVAAKLTSLGVEIPNQDPEPPASGYSPAAPIAPPPPEKIILDDAAPEPLAASPAPVATPVTGEPRLISEDGSSIPLDEGTLTVGRDATMGLSLLSESTVSRQHAELVRTGSSVVLKDMGSTNGTFVNGQKVDGEVQLRPGDKVQFGAVKFRYEG